MKLSKLGWIGLAVGIGFSGVSYAEDDRYFITNQSGVTIDELYIAASSTKSWGNDVLGKDTMPNGETGEIVFHPEDQRCDWDVAIKDTNGQELEWDNIDLCKYTKIVLKPGGVVELQ